MHEMSVALEVCRLAEEQVGRDALPRVTGVGLEVGDRSGIVADNLAFCLDTLLTQHPFRIARTVIRQTLGDALRLDWLELEDRELEDRELEEAHTP
jgi:Zn finger protein HypA/HybF involved in hydrogenase expression